MADYSGVSCTRAVTAEGAPGLRTFTTMLTVIGQTPAANAHQYCLKSNTQYYIMEFSKFSKFQLRISSDHAFHRSVSSLGEGNTTLCLLNNISCKIFISLWDILLIVDSLNSSHTQAFTPAAATASGLSAFCKHYLEVSLLQLDRFLHQYVLES